MMKINDTLYGFRVSDVRELPHLDATMYLLEHIKCGAKLCFLNRHDASRTFSITFPTPPTDDTGVFHILEHSVLCGSDKFPTKEPFTELLKGSLNTFLNAMTYSDRTAYPVASRNDKDFYNLVDVYMDAVLHPKAVTDERIFRQEGWRYEVDDEGNVGYNGVVYSEMKGVYSSPDSIAAYHSARLLFPGGTYSYDSGGHPDAITSLTYEGFVEAHKRHYNPTGAYMFLDGDPKLDEILPLLDSYLKEYDRCEAEFKVERGGDIITEPLYESYEVEDSEDEADKGRVYLTYVTRDFSDSKAHTALAAITDAICDSNDAPLKKAILASGLCDNVYVYSSPGCKWGTLNIEFRNVKDGCENELISHFDKALREMLSAGIDKSLIKASIDLIEFKTREADYGSSPKGIVYLSAINDVWLYGMHPVEALEYEKSFKELREALEEDYLERLLTEILDTPRATLILRPSKSIAREREAASDARLAESLGELTEEKLTALAEQTIAFSEWQSTPNTPEALATIPTLTVEDLGDEPAETPSIITEYNGATLIDHPIPTGGITYTDIYFDASDTPTEDIPLLAFMGLVYPNLDTERGSANYFRTRGKSTLGSIALSVLPVKCRDEARLYLSVRYSCLDTKKGDALELAGEYMYGVILENRAATRRALTQYTATYQDLITERGHSIAATRSAARHSRFDALKERTAGYEFYRWLKRYKDATDEEIDALTARMRTLREKILVRERATLSLTGKNDEIYTRAAINAMKSGTPAAVSYIELLPKANEGIAIPSQVSYAALAGNLYDTGAKMHNGAWSTLSTILDFEVLWEEVRVKGGAYGVGFSSRSNSGTTLFYSYRDPSPARTLSVYRKAPELLREMLEGEEDLTRFIIGSVGALDPVTTPATDGNDATTLYLAGLSHADVIKKRRECIATTKEKLIELSYLLDEIIEKSTFTVVGPRELLGTLGVDEILEI